MAAAAVTQPSATRSLLFPLEGRQHALRNNFNEKRGLRTHKALDIMAPRGTPVRAIDDGRIAKLYRGPLRDNEGTVILKDGEVIANDDNKFKLGVNFIVEGGVGKTGLKN